MHKIIWIYTAFLLTILTTSCRQKKKDHQNIVKDTTITQVTSFNDLFLDSNTIANYLNANTAFKPYADYFETFYKQRNFEYAWFDSTGMIEQAGNLISMINNAINQNGDSSLYDPHLQDLYQKYHGLAIKNFSPKEINDVELYFTGSFFSYLSKVYNGTAELNAAQLDWFIPRKKLDMSKLLEETLNENKNPDYEAFFNPAYQKLRDALERYKNISKEHANWKPIYLNTKKLQLEDENPAIPKIKERLTAFGDMDVDDGTSFFDENMQAAVKSFQKRFGLKADGIIGRSFINIINIPVDSLIRKILINIERARWLPAHLPSNYIWVNIPAYQLTVYDPDSTFYMPVIVGSAAHNTVIFSGNLKYIVFAPYWNIPSSIIQKEVWPGMKRNSNYIADHNMKVTGYKKSGEPIVVQLPGPNNALGRVKFLFPNDYDIYLHDTPNRDLFANRNRSLSHGCIRISDPEKMANYLLRNNNSYTAEIIDSLMNRNLNETWVTLKPTIPVYLVYFTAWVDDDGNIDFRQDIYKHDQKVAKKLFK